METDKGQAFQLSKSRSPTVENKAQETLLGREVVTEPGLDFVPAGTSWRSWDASRQGRPQHGFCDTLYCSTPWSRIPVLLLGWLRGTGLGNVL